MVKAGDIMKTVKPEDYPCTVEVLEIYPCGTKAKCLYSDTDGCFYKDYDLTELRYTSAKEIFEDVVKFYHIEEPSDMEFYSQKFIDWLKSESADYEAFRDQKMEECEQEDMDIEDLDSDELWEFDQAAEKSGWLLEIAEMIENELNKIKTANPNITVQIPEMYGKLVANPSMDPNYPGIDIEFVPDIDNGHLSNPRVLFEAHDDAAKGINRLHVHLWNDRDAEDCTIKVDMM